MIDETKEYTTRDGREVRIYATDCGGLYPVHGAFREGDCWTACKWCADGAAYSGQTRTLDLIEKPVRTSRWANVYSDVLGGLYPDKCMAQRQAGRSPVGLIRLDFEGDKLVAVAIEGMSDG